MRDSLWLGARVGYGFATALMLMLILNHGGGNRVSLVAGAQPYPTVLGLGCMGRVGTVP
jgi:hypothetical protein